MEWAKTILRKIYILMIVVLPLSIYFYFNNTYDPFLPKHIAIISEVSRYGVLELGTAGDIPNYYILGSIIQLFSGIDVSSMLCLPVQLIPHMVLYFLLIYIISKNKLLSLIISSIILFLGSNGSGNVFYWPHGIGSLLFLISILLLYIMLSRRETFKRCVFLLTIISISLIYFSYNYAFRTDLLIFSLLMSIIFISLIFKKIDMRVMISNVLSITSILVVSALVIFILNNFFYDSFLPAFDIAESIDISVLDKLSVAFFSSTSSLAGLEEVILSYPKIFTYINILRYGVVLFGVVLYLILIIQSMVHKHKIEVIDIILISLIISTIIYSVFRIGIGSNPLANLFIPSLLCLIRALYLEKIGSIIYKITKLLLIVLVLLVISYVISYAAYGYISPDLEHYSQYQSESAFLVEWGDTISIRSDEGTKDLLILNMLNPDNESMNVKKYNELFNNLILILHRDIVKKILDHQDISEISPTYLIRNDIVPLMSLQNWIIIQNWGVVADRWDTNMYLNRVFENGAISIYFLDS